MPQFDLNFEFGGQPTEPEVSVQEENELVTERTRFIALEKHELNKACKILKQQKHHLCNEMEVYVVESHNNGMVSQLLVQSRFWYSASFFYKDFEVACVESFCKIEKYDWVDEAFIDVLCPFIHGLHESRNSGVKGSKTGVKFW